jgi:hypothetical protein
LVKEKDYAQWLKEIRVTLESILMIEIAYFITAVMQTAYLWWMLSLKINDFNEMMTDRKTKSTPSQAKFDSTEEEIHRPTSVARQSILNNIDDELNNTFDSL